MEKRIKITLIILAICLLIVGIIGGIVVGINKNNKLKALPDKPIIYKSGKLEVDDEDTGYKTVEYEGKKFIMYGKIKPKDLLGNINYAYGNCLGYVDDDNSDRIYALNGESTDEWLIEYYVTGIMEEPVILREITTKNKKEIPSSVESFDYDYWKQQITIDRGD